MLFAHNGMLQGLDALEAHLGRDMRFVGGDTDSERYFALVAKEIRARGNVGVGISAAVSWIAENLPVYSMNFVLATPNELWAFRYPETHQLFVLERRAGGGNGRRDLHHVSGTMRVQVPYLHQHSSVVVASEPLDDSARWRPLDSGELLRVGPDLSVRSSLVVDRRPAELIRLGHAARAAALGYARRQGRPVSCTPPMKKRRRAAREPDARQSHSWLGHSTVLFEADWRPPHDRSGATTAGAFTCGEPASLPSTPQRLDAVLISHVHYDHLDLRSLRRLGGSPLFVVPRGAGSLLRNRGFDHVREVEPGDEEQIRGISVRATHAEHDSRRGPFSVETPPLGFVVSGSASTYFAGDTDVFAGMGAIADDLDVALLPVAGWGPKLPPGHLNPHTATEALALLRPRIAIPIHWGTYRRIGLSRDPLELRKPAESFIYGSASDLALRVDVRFCRSEEASTCRETLRWRDRRRNDESAVARTAPASNRARRRRARPRHSDLRLFLADDRQLRRGLVVVKTLSWPWIAALPVAATISVVTFAPPRMIVLPRPRSSRAAVDAGIHCSLLGCSEARRRAAAVAFRVLRRWGFATRDIARAVT
jgi:L-ascorbate metabolism protein UlaG (beta-lactamase superfamily)